MTGNNVRYPKVKVQLTGPRGTGGDAFAILGAVTSELRAAKVPQATISEFFDEATAGSYDNLLATVMRWVLVR